MMGLVFSKARFDRNLSDLVFIRQTVIRVRGYRRTIRYLEALQIEYASSLHTDLFYVMHVQELI